MGSPRGLVGPPPVRVRAGDGPWEALDTALEDGDYALAYGFLADWDPDGRTPGELTRLLGTEADRYGRLECPEARRRFAASRLLLKHVAAAVLRARPEELELARHPNGRPYLRGCGQLEVSLSHTGTALAVGLSRRGPIGVDIEPSGRTVYGTGLEEEVCTGHERSQLGWLPEPERNGAVIRLWTLKEAYSKALGHGLRLPFRSFGFTTPLTATAVPRLLAVDGTPADDVGWQFETHPLADGYTLSTAVSPPGTGPGAPQPTEAGDLLDKTMTSAVLGCYRKDDPQPAGAHAPGRSG
ncbi:4'-phosphopantetheinyl transferase superfamily protein [Streptomyces sp. TRM 70351]|uniref:4'-phosphopantetheinyl transferase family protein n=1 Tax=Streptomyces sp. TRM 70351 TaxID=3116552 RepID=UPI002E7B654D|nr:4'-phosphopantetheinyl transferase superfamily protein [Streptomyces sp. TRM 70351]MEE1929378.1 4'-phosphopantetheinyl transferase superfamily protein [Streptomyces sp. TRM 70351]